MLKQIVLSLLLIVHTQGLTQTRNFPEEQQDTV